MTNKQVQRWELYNKIVERYEKQTGHNPKGMKRLSLLMDIETADQKFHLRLQEWLEADDWNFAHDWNGIHTNLNRQTKTFENNFIPRFAEGEI